MKTPVLDPDVVTDVAVRSGAVSRREALRKTSLYGLALASSPLALAALSRKAYGQTIELPQAVRDALLFALTLEHLEYEFYDQGVASGIINADYSDVFTVIRDHERDHVLFLQDTLDLAQGTGPGAAGRPPNGFDFTAGGLYAPFDDEPTFLVLSQGFEDTGVRAYKGQAGILQPVDGVLTAALQIHSVEARHASIVRRIRGEKGYITQSNTTADPGTIQDTYAAGTTADAPAESNTVQGGLDLRTALSGYSADAITEAFDEALDKDAVLEIVAPFIAA